MYMDTKINHLIVHQPLVCGSLHRAVTLKLCYTFYSEWLIYNFKKAGDNSICAYKLIMNLETAFTLFGHVVLLNQTMS